MEHNNIRHRLSEYIDESVAAEEKAAIEAHLKTCQQCNAALNELRKTIENIKAIEEIEPPVWMTQKIMATVRAAAEEKKGLFQRLFYPLAVKIPIRAIAVLFLAVTGFYIYQNIQPAERLSEAPIKEFTATKQAPQAETKRDTLAKADRPATRSKQTPQTPAYKALDMKLEYEKPAPPIATGMTAESAPATPADESAQAKNIAASDKHPAEAQTSARTMVQDRSEQSSGIMPNKEEDTVLTGRSCKENPHVIGECFKVHGRLGLTNGTPSVRLWKIGTDRILGIAEGSFTLEGYRNIPEAIEKQLNRDIYLYGDYIVCPFTPDKPGTIQHICIESASNLTIKRKSDK